jgi:hypothetical protein
VSEGSDLRSCLDGKAIALYIRRAMKTFVFSILLLGVLAVLGSSLMHAADPQLPLQKGRVLILNNEYTIEGDIERVGDHYRIRNKLAETCIPAQRALALVASLPDAYAYLRKRINLGDPDERLRLARWCWRNGLQKQGLAELQAAAELRPSHAETRRLLVYWQQESAKTTRTAQRAGSVGDGKASGSSAKPADPPPIEVTTESLGVFATRVQPILMNTCARCHATGHGGNFHLTQVFENNISNRRTLERNLAAVLTEVDVSQPEASPLLIKAVSDHAHTGQAPLRDRQSAPYRTLESWVKRTVADNPHLCSKSDSRQPKSEKSVFPVEEQRAKGGEESEWGAEKLPHTAPVSSPVSRGDVKKAPKSAPASPAGASAADPYDPEPFNRKMHPEANKTQPGK